MSTIISLVLGVFWTLAGFTPPTPPQQPQAASASSPQRAFLDKYCVTCHNDRAKTAGIAFDKMDIQKVGADPATWERAVLKLRAHAMPPAGRPRPDKDTYEGFRIWLENELDKSFAASPNPGTTATYHRLNRAEYQNAIRDLLGVDIDASDFLPEDPASFGFDNIGGAIMMSPDLLDTYM